VTRQQTHGKPDGNELEDSLTAWANTDDIGSDFLARLESIPDSHAQIKQALWRRALKAAGGWGFAAPQLAGLVLATYFGVASGAATENDETLLIDESVSAHIFGDSNFEEEVFEG